MRTADKQSIKRHSQQYKESVLEAYSKCYPESSRYRDRSVERNKKLTAEYDSAVEVDKNSPNIKLNPSQINAPKTLSEASNQQKDRKIFSFKVYSFVEREYARRTMQHINRIEKKAMKEKKKVVRANSTSNAQVSSSHNSSKERSDVRTSKAGLEVGRPGYYVP